MHLLFPLMLGTLSGFLLFIWGLRTGYDLGRKEELYRIRQSAESLSWEDRAIVRRVIEEGLERSFGQGKKDLDEGH